VDLPAQILRELGVGIGDRLVLADEAAELFGQLDRARRGHRVLLGRHRVGGEHQQRRQRDRGEQHQKGEPSSMMCPHACG
jgi:hypothetical protein